MFILTLCTDIHEQRLLVLEFLSIKSQEELITNGVYSLDELYPGEFDDFCVCGSYSKEACEPLEPKLKDRDSKMPAEQPNHQPEAEVEGIGLISFNFICTISYFK
ncbi:hypothetical protein NMG60_11025524 [Bertholletia excelsa]